MSMPARAPSRRRAPRPIVGRMTAPCPAFGFSVALELAPGASLDALGAAFAALLESRGLRLRETGRLPRREYVVTSEASQATELDRDAVGAWLGARPELARVRVGPLVDLAGDD